MRFYKVLQNTNANYYNGDLFENEIVCFSFYFRRIVVISDGHKSTRFIFATDSIKLNLILTEKVRPLTQQELNKIKPHLRIEHLKYDL